jgi:two-component system cell cycle response regulator CpdR
MRRPVDVVPSRVTRRADGKKRVLVVDDSAPIRDFVAQALENAGFEVVAVTSTRAAAEALASEPIDLLVTDVTLLDGSGTALARSARAVQPELPIVLMSGTEELDAAFDAALTKPFDEKTLLETVARAMGAHVADAAR